MSSSVWHMVMDSGKMELADALNMFQSESPSDVIEFWAEEANQEIPEYEQGGDAVYKQFGQIAKDTILAQENAISLIFENCEIGESGYETGMMQLASEVVSDDADVVQQIIHSYHSITGDDDEVVEERKFWYHYVIERTGDIGWKILFDLGVDMEEFYHRDGEWAAVYNGGFGHGPGELHPGGIVQWVQEYKAEKLSRYNEKFGV